jgi:hypothetical protein
MYPSRLDVLEEQRHAARTDLEMLPKINEDAVYHNEAAQVRQGIRIHYNF